MSSLTEPFLAPGHRGATPLGNNRPQVATVAKRRAAAHDQELFTPEPAEIDPTAPGAAGLVICAISGEIDRLRIEADPRDRARIAASVDIWAGLLRTAAAHDAVRAGLSVAEVGRCLGVTRQSARALVGRS